MKTKKILSHRYYVGFLLGLFMILVPNTVFGQQNRSINDLFVALEKSTATKADDIKTQQAEAYKSFVNSQFYPTLEGFGRYDYSSIPAGMYPVPPNELFPMMQDQTIAQPFSSNIYRLGGTIAMPIFVKSIFTMSEQAKKIVGAAKEQAYINKLKNQSVLVSSNANLKYIENLTSALEKKKASLLKTQEFIKIKVNNGRAAGSTSLNINTSINEVNSLINNLEIQKLEIIASIQSLTGIVLNHSVPMEQIGVLQAGGIKITKPLQDKIEADALYVRAEKEKLLPSVMAQGNYAYSFSNAYNNDKAISGDLTVASVVIKIPVFNKSQYAQIHKSKLDLEASQNEFQKLTDDFSAQALQLEKTLALLGNSIQLYQNSIKDKEELNNIAVLSYQLEQMSMEDYLKYEDDLVLEKAKLYNTQAQKWQVLMKLAIIYGIDSKTLVK